MNIDGLLKNVESHKPPAELREKILAHVAVTPQEQPTNVTPIRPRVRTLLAYGLAMAAALLLAVQLTTPKPFAQIMTATTTETIDDDTDELSEFMDETIGDMYAADERLFFDQTTVPDDDIFLFIDDYESNETSSSIGANYHA